MCNGNATFPVRAYKNLLYLFAAKFPPCKHSSIQRSMEEGEPRVPKTRINEMRARSDAAKAAALAPGAAAQAAAAQVSMVVRTLDGSEVDLDAAQEFGVSATGLNS
jgi:hypothetical protein